MNDFQKTVDLSDKMATQNGQSLDKPKKRVPRKKKTVKKAEAIDEVFKDDDNEMHRISRPSKNESDDGFYKKVSFILFFALFAVVVYFMFFSKVRTDDNLVKSDNAPGWYSVKLMNNETYYGEIKDTTADPIVIENVYYNYDQINADKTGETVTESANLRLVKRGKETHGPDGTMSIVRAQVVFMEPLKEESKVLKAILNYEK